MWGGGEGWLQTRSRFSLSGRASCSFCPSHQPHWIRDPASSTAADQSLLSCLVYGRCIPSVHPNDSENTSNSGQVAQPPPCVCAAGGHAGESELSGKELRTDSWAKGLPYPVWPKNYRTWTLPFVKVLIRGFCDLKKVWNKLMGHRENKQDDGKILTMRLLKAQIIAHNKMGVRAIGARPWYVDHDDRFVLLCFVLFF